MISPVVTDSAMGHVCPMAAPPKDRVLAGGFGARVAAACTMAGIMTAKELSHRTGLDEKTCRNYLGGKLAPKMPNAIRLAETLEVSIDWLVLGRENPPAGLVAWLDGPGREASPETRRYLIDLPLRGYRAQLEFYALIMELRSPGVQRRTAEEMVQMARAHLRQREAVQRRALP